MAEQSDAFYAIVGRALSEPEFRETLRSPAFREEELGKMGITLTSEQGEELERTLDAVDVARSAIRGTAGRDLTKGTRIEGGAQVDEDRGGIEITQGEFSQAFYAVVGRALSDATYREELLSSDPEMRAAAAAKAGLVWNPDLDKKLEDAIAAIDRLADHFGNSAAAT